MGVTSIANFNDSDNFSSLFLRPLDRRYQIWFHSMLKRDEDGVELGAVSILFLHGSSAVTAAYLSCRIPWRQQAGTSAQSLCSCTPDPRCDGTAPSSPRLTADTAAYNSSPVSIA